MKQITFLLMVIFMLTGSLGCAHSVTMRGLSTVSDPNADHIWIIITAANGDETILYCDDGLEDLCRKYNTRSR